LPLNVNVRSKWGYAFSNELGEMENIKETFPYTNKLGQKIRNKTEFWNESYDDNILAVPYVFAMANKNYEICDWLVVEKNVPYVPITPAIAQRILEQEWKWSDVCVPMTTFIKTESCPKKILSAIQLCVKMIRDEISVEEFINSIIDIGQLKGNMSNPFTDDDTIQIVSALKLKKKEIKMQCHMLLGCRFFKSLDSFMWKCKRPIEFLKKITKDQISVGRFINEIRKIDKDNIFNFLDDNDRSQVIEGLVYRKVEFKKSCSEILSLKPYNSC